MIARTLLAAGCLCVGIVLLWPGEGSRFGGSQSGGNGGLAETEAHSVNSLRTSGQSERGWYGGGHTLERQGDGHFYADGAANGANIRFLVDTGASVVALTGADAEAAGLNWNESEVRPVGSGASGPVYGVTRRIDEIEIGGITRRGINAVIIPDGLDVSLLGQSFLSQVKSVEIVQDRMVLQEG